MGRLRLRELRPLVQGHRTSGRAGDHTRSGSVRELDCSALGLVLGREAIKCLGGGMQLKKEIGGS